MASTSSSTPTSFQAPPTVRKINDALYELYKPTTGFIDIEIIFFHGLQVLDYSQAYLKTWMSADDSECWLNTWLPQEFPTARILSVTYDSSIHVSNSTGRMDMYTVGENLAHSLIGLEGIGQSCPVVLVGHCIGGIVLKQLCNQADQMGATGPGHNPYKTFLGNMKRAFFYSTPNSGSRAVLSAKQRGPLLQYLELLSKHNARLNANFAQLRQQNGWKTFGVGESNETEASRSIMRIPNLISGFFNTLPQFSLDVEEGSARYDMDDFCVLSGEDNFSICKPRDRRSSSYKCLVKFVQEVLQIEEFVKCNWLETLRMPLTFIDRSSRVKRVVEELGLYPRLALTGMGGIGKTTLAKAVLVKIRGNFDFSCFIADVKGQLKSQSKSLHDLVAENLFLGTGMKIYLHDRGAESLWLYLLGKKVLLIMDDVASEDQISSLLSFNWLGKGSRIIITSRIRSRARMPTFRVHDVLLLSGEESEDLFLAQLDAEVVGRVPKDLVAKVVHMCQGLPLTLEVIGGYLRFERDVCVWNSALHKLTEAESVDGSKDDCLWAKLRVSLDEMAKPERKLFLDIAVFDEEIDPETWRDAWETGVDGSSVDVDLRNLVDRSLIKLQNVQRGSETGDCNYVAIFQMHQQLRDLGKSLSRPPSDKLELCRACWRQEDVQVLLNLYEGNEAHTEIVSVERITPPLACQRSYLWSAIARLQELRLLRLSDAIMRGDESHRFPFKLRYLHLTSCFKVSDKKFKLLGSHCWPIREVDVAGLQQLSVLHLDSCSSVRLPSNFYKLSNLKVLIIKRTPLKDFPNNFGHLPRLRTMILEDVPISQLPSSFVQILTLRDLTLKGCSLKAARKGFVPQLAPRGARDSRPLHSLTNLRLVDLPGLTELPRTFGLLESLEDLQIRRCSALKELPEGFSELSNLHRLHIDRCLSLKSLSESLGELGSLMELKIVWCPRLLRLPDSLGRLRSLCSLHLTQLCLQRLPETLGQLNSLKELWIWWCKDLESLPETLGQLKSLKTLFIAACEDLERLPDSVGQLDALEFLFLSCCPRLERLPESVGQLSKLWYLTISGSERLENLPDSVGQLSTLRVLDLSLCKNLWRLPDCLRESKTLQICTMGCNRLETVPNTARAA